MLQHLNEHGDLRDPQMTPEPGEPRLAIGITESGCTAGLAYAAMKYGASKGMVERAAAGVAAEDKAEENRASVDDLRNAIRGKSCIDHALRGITINLSHMACAIEALNPAERLTHGRNLHDIHFQASRTIDAIHKLFGITGVTVPYLCTDGNLLPGGLHIRPPNPDNVIPISAPRA